MSARLPQPATLEALARRLGGEIQRGSPALLIHRLASLNTAGAGDLSFYSSASHKPLASTTAASAVLAPAALADHLPETAAVIVCADAYLSYARVAQWIADSRSSADLAAPGIHPSASIDAGARIGAGVSIGPHCVVGAGAQIGEQTRIDSGCHVGQGVTIGSGSHLWPSVTIYPDCEIGARVLIHSGTVIGSDGFGYAPDGQRWIKIAQLGRVVIGDDVEIGSNCSIDRGALDDTRIGNGCKLDNLIQIAHNVVLGEHCALAGCVGIAGSAVIGNRCRIGGSAGILGHLEICDDVTISAMTLVTRSIGRPGFYSGVFPLMDNADWEKAAAALKRLPDLRQRLRLLEKRSGNF